MSRSIPLCIALLATLGAGCATTEETAARAPSSDESRLDQDTAYMQRVEQIALRRGIQVTWVHPPTKRRAPDAD